MTTADHHQVVSALDLLRLSGADKVAKVTAKKLVDEGPIEPLAEVTNAVDMSAATRTSLAASVRMIAESADVLSAEAADRHARWALKILRDPGDFEIRLRPHFIVADELIGLVRRLRASVSPEVDHEIREHTVSLPPIVDDLAANRYARLVARRDRSSRRSTAPPRQGLSDLGRSTGAPSAVSELLDQILSEPGGRLALAVSETLTDESHANLDPLLRRLSGHPSAVVRWRANHALSRVRR